MLKRWFGRAVLSRSWLTFLVMGLAFFVFGVGTYNFFMQLSANIDLIANYGWMALTDGAARQFVELGLTGYLSMAAYVVFKTCEYQLAHDLAGAGGALGQLDSEKVCLHARIVKEQPVGAELCLRKHFTQRISCGHPSAG